MPLRLVVPLLLALTLPACPSSPPPSTSPGERPPEPKPEPVDTPPPSGEARPPLSIEDCKSRGGTVVADEGDGTTHHRDYKCPSGGAPLGIVTPAAGGPIPRGQAVCCPK